MNEQVQYSIVIDDTWGRQKSQGVEDLGFDDLQVLWLKLTQEIVTRGIEKEKVVEAVYNKIVEY